MKHRHHIVPKHAGGTDDPSNLIELTVEEHAEAHRKLWEEHGRWQDQIAWQVLSGMIGADEGIRRAISNTHKGKVLSEEHRAILSKTHKGKIVSAETRQKMSKAAQGRVFSEETRAKLRAARARQSSWNKGKSLTQQHKDAISYGMKNINTSGLPPPSSGAGQ